MEPQKFGRYEIKADIGRGGMATVYHAYDPRFEREVALKVLPREMLHDPQFRTRFEREAKTIAMLEHPAIVPVYDFGEEDGQPYFVMRYMTGGSLSDKMKQGAMTIQEVATLFGRLAPALDEAHAKGIIHRDLKPGNILFDQYGDPYISDFGIAKISATQTNVTGSAIVGTPAYMSPEQAQGEGIDGRSDIYGLGVILFELLSGQQPYHGDTPMSVVVKHITDPVPHILDIQPDLPPGIEPIIEKTMAKDRNQRFPTVKALTDALEAVARGDTPDLENVNKTLIASPKTTVSKSPIADTRTVLAKKGQAPGLVVPGPDSVTEPPRKKTGLWIGLGGGMIVIIGAVVVGLLLFRDKIPFLAAPTQTRSVMLVSTETSIILQPKSTITSQGVVPPIASDTPNITDTPSLTPSDTPVPTATTPVLAHMGGADLIAFLNNNDIWVIGVDGKGLIQLTRDGTVKDNLQWSLDGSSVFYISGKCIQAVTLNGGVVSQMTCFPAAEYLDGFQISPDGKQVAISLNRVEYVVPFDLAKLSNAHTWAQLMDMKGCFSYGNLTNQDPVVGARWSTDGKEIAFDTYVADTGTRVELIRVFDISACNSASPKMLDNFPANRNGFPMIGYSAHPVIPSYDWNGSTLFVLNSPYRYELGYLYSYFEETKYAIKIDPLQTGCCYTAARFSPDGNYLFFIYQNINSGANAKTQLFFISYGSIGSGSVYSPLPLPDGFFSVQTDHLDATLRSVKP